jgi:hypothetical protein
MISPTAMKNFTPDQKASYRDGLKVGLMGASGIEVYCREELKQFWDRGFSRGAKCKKQLDEVASVRGKTPEEIMTLAISQLWHNAPCKETPAQGVKGCLLMHEGEAILRVYDHSSEKRLAYANARKQAGATRVADDPMFDFKDYRIVHHDMDITIDEKHASLFETFSGDRFIDYNSEATGQIVVKEENEANSENS